MVYRVFSVCFSVFIFVACQPLAARPTYALRKTGNIVEVYERHTRKTVWRRFFLGGCSDVQWSKDHRTVVFETSGFPQTKPEHRYFGFSLVAWQAGGRVKLLFHQECEQFDYVEDFYWSPDNKFMMFRTGSSGASDIDEGVLWCLNLSTGKADFVSGEVAGPDWIKPYWKTVKIFTYWHLMDVENPPPGELHHKVSKQPNQYMCR